MMGLVNRKWPMMRSVNVHKVARARSVDHKGLFWAMGMTHRPKIGHVGNVGLEMANCEPWGYVAPVVAAVVMRATGVRHIYLIDIVPI